MGEPINTADTKGKRRENYILSILQTLREQDGRTTSYDTTTSMLLCKQKECCKMQDHFQTRQYQHGCNGNIILKLVNTHMIAPVTLSSKLARSIWKLIWKTLLCSYTDSLTISTAQGFTSHPQLSMLKLLIIVDIKSTFASLHFPSTT